MIPRRAALPVMLRAVPAPFSVSGGALAGPGR